LLVSIEEWRTHAEDRGLAAFLDHVSLLTSLDEGESERQAVTLMTVHAAKGLEYDTVFVTGLEEEVFPHFNSKDDESIEEERRLAYVAITRAERKLSLSWARSRRRFGRTAFNPPSRFLAEIPEELKAYEAESGRVIRPGIRPKAPSWTQGASFGAESESQVTRPAGGWASPAVASAQTDSDEPMLDYTETQVAPAFDGSLVGRTVRHPRFGDGRVARIDGRGPEARVTVQFPGFGSKKIVARFLELDA
jgi:DNA helicase-2/ATP-dependent DNA helicase PcrA